MKGINGVLLACEKCTRGHRVAQCSHSDQKLIVIQPKGRPSSQCGVCKEKRKNSSFHGRCACAKTHLSMRKKESTSNSWQEGSCDCDFTGYCTCCSLPASTSNTTPPPPPFEESKDCSSKSYDTAEKSSKNDGPFLIPAPNQAEESSAAQATQKDSKGGIARDNASSDVCLFSKDVSKEAALDDSHSSDCCQAIASRSTNVSSNEQQDKNVIRCESCYVCLFGSSCPTPNDDTL